MPVRELVLVPGLLNDSDLWSDQIAALSPHIRCRVADITQGNSLRALAEQVVGTVTEPTFALAGFSLGGFVAQEVIRIAGDRVERLALLDTSITADTPERAAGRAEVSRASATSGRFHGFGERMIKAYVAPASLGNPAIAQRIRAMTARLGAEVLICQNGIERKDGHDVISGLDRPLLVLCGEHDLVTPLAGHREMAALNPKWSQLRIIEDAGHMTPIEKPAEVTRALLEWLERDSQPRGP